MVAKVMAATLVGVDACLVTVEVNLIKRSPGRSHPATPRRARGPAGNSPRASVVNPNGPPCAPGVRLRLLD